jgi:peptidoglycan/LPS O-acetylase OafA/YrhL
MLFHLGFCSWALSLPLGVGTTRSLLPALPRLPELAPIAWTGWVGVEVFFVLSGFVIAYSAEASSAFLFLRSRFLRLMPAVWICASLAFALLIEEGMIPFNELLPLYLKTIILIPKRPWIDTVYWSLCVEVVFYGLILSLLLANRFCRVEFVMGTIGLASTLCCIMLAFFITIPGYLNWLAQLLLLRHGCLFALGSLFMAVALQTIHGSSTDNR